MDKTARIAAEKIIDNQAWASIFMTVGHIYTKTDRESLVKATAAIIEAEYAPVMETGKSVLKILGMYQDPIPKNEIIEFCGMLGLDNLNRFKRLLDD